MKALLTAVEPLSATLCGANACNTITDRSTLALAASSTAFPWTTLGPGALGAVVLASPCRRRL